MAKIVNRIIMDWREERLSDRLERCRRMLAFHGVASCDEARKIQRRIKLAFGRKTRERLRCDTCRLRRRIAVATSAADSPTEDER